MYRTCLLSVVLLFSSLILLAQQPPVPQDIKKDLKRMQEERNKMEKEQQKLEQEMKQGMKQMQEEAQKLREQDIERLKELNPELYKEAMVQQKRQEKINKIISDFRQKKFSKTIARKRLFPLIKEEMKRTIETLPQTIERYEKELEFLKKVEKTPKILINKYIDEALGLKASSPEGATLY